MSGADNIVNNDLDILEDKEILFASCDIKYFNNFGYPLVNSILENTSNHIHINIVNSEEKENFDLTHDNVSFSFTNLSAPPRALLASYRFLMLPEILQRVKKVLVIDADSIVNKHIDFPDSDWGLFLREPLPGTRGIEHYGSHVAAGAVFMTAKALPIANWISTNIKKIGEESSWPWFVDQLVLYKAYENFKDQYNFKAIEPSFIDWEFNDDTSIWTGKGPRKYNNTKFTTAVTKYKK